MPLSAHSYPRLRVTPRGDYQPGYAHCPVRPRSGSSLRASRGTDLGTRIEALPRHHLTRLAEIERAVACDPGLSTWDAPEALTWSCGWDQTRGIALNIDRGRDSWVSRPRCSAGD